MPVSIRVGASALAVMPWAAYSSAIDFVSAITPALDAAYAGSAGGAAPAPVMPALEPMATIRPYPASRIRETARRAHRNGPVRLTSSIRRQSSLVVSSSDAFERMPAFSTSSSTGPSSASMRVKASSTLGSLETSSETASTPSIASVSMSPLATCAP